MLADFNNEGIFVITIKIKPNQARIEKKEFSYSLVDTTNNRFGQTVRSFTSRHNQNANKFEYFFTVLNNDEFDNGSRQQLQLSTTLASSRESDCFLANSFETDKDKLDISLIDSIAHDPRANFTFTVESVTNGTEASSSPVAISIDSCPSSICDTVIVKHKIGNILKAQIGNEFEYETQLEHEPWFWYDCQVKFTVNGDNSGIFGQDEQEGSYEYKIDGSAQNVKIRLGESQITGSSCPQQVALYQEILFYDGKTGIGTGTYLNNFLDDELFPLLEDKCQLWLINLENMTEELCNVLELANKIRKSSQEMSGEYLEFIISTTDFKYIDEELVLRVRTYNEILSERSEQSLRIKWQFEISDAMKPTFSEMNLDTSYSLSTDGQSNKFVKLGQPSSILGDVDRFVVKFKVTDPNGLPSSNCQTVCPYELLSEEIGTNQSQSESSSDHRQYQIGFYILDDLFDPKSGSTFYQYVKTKSELTTGGVVSEYQELNIELRIRIKSLVTSKKTNYYTNVRYIKPKIDDNDQGTIDPDNSSHEDDHDQDETIEPIVDDDQSKEPDEENDPDTDESTEDAIADLLNIDDVASAEEQSQKVLSDSDQVKQFDIFEYLKEHDMDFEFNKREDIPQEISLQIMKNDFSTPFSKKGIDSLGQLVLKFSHEIQDPTLDALVQAFEISDTNSRILQSTQNVQLREKMAENGVTELEAMQHILKISGSLKIEIESPDGLNIDKKGFNWQLISFTSQEMRLQFTFEHPQYISVGNRPDIFFINFFNTKKYLQPKDKSQSQVLHDGFQLSFPIPLQSVDSLTQEQVSQIQSNGQLMIGIYLIASIFMRDSVQHVLGSIIISFQILAHLPLLQIIIPAQSNQAFEIMMIIVSFDYFEVSNIIDFGFTETRPWSENFGKLGYDSINFIEGMGSISLFFSLGILWTILVLILYMTKQCKGNSGKKTKLQKLFSPMKAFQNSISFVSGVFMETLICAIVGMRMFKLAGFLTKGDQFSIAWQMIFVLILVLFTGFTLFFTFFIIPKIVIKQKSQNLEVFENVLITIQQKFKATQKAKSEQILRSKTLQKIRSLEGEQIIQILNKKNKQLRDQSLKINKDKFRLFAPLFDGLNYNSRLKLFYNSYTVFRRCALISIAIWADRQPWLQITLFMLSGLLTMVYLCYSNPFVERTENQLNKFNEYISLLIAYGIMLINGVIVDVPSMQMVGDRIRILLYILWVFNGLTFMLFIVRATIRQCRRCFFKAVTKKRLLAARDQSKSKKTQSSKENSSIQPKKSLSSLKAVNIPLKPQQLKTIMEDIEEDSSVESEESQNSSQSQKPNTTNLLLNPAPATNLNESNEPAADPSNQIFSAIQMLSSHVPVLAETQTTQFMGITEDVEQGGSTTSREPTTQERKLQYRLPLDSISFSKLSIVSTSKVTDKENSV